MTKKKKMYVVFCEDNEKYWCSYNTWSDQLRKATIFHSTKYANEVHKRYKELRLKNVEVRMEVVPEKPTNADRIRSMSDEELSEFLTHINPTNCQDCAFSHGWRCQPDRDDYSDFEKCEEGRKRWLQQPAEENKNDV